MLHILKFEQLSLSLNRYNCPITNCFDVTIYQLMPINEIISKKSLA